MRDRQTTDHYDVIIVGARVAGAATATMLARAGVRVLVVDQARYGSDTLSTHLFMRGGVLQLHRLGVLEALLRAGTPPLHRTVARYGAVEDVVDIRPGPGVPALVAPRRHVLDRVLIDTAMEAGAQVRFQTRLTGLRRDHDDRVVGIDAEDHRGRRIVASAPLTIGADGVRSRVAREVGAFTYAQGQHASSMVVGYWSDVDIDGHRMVFGEGGAGGLIPTDDGQVCAWVGGPSTGFAQQRAEPDLGFDRGLRRIAPAWMDELSAGRRQGPLRGFPGIPGFLRQPWGRGWALVGDASHFKDPLTTHGMTDALRDAELLARAVVDGMEGERPREHALAAYQDLRDGLCSELFLLSDRLAAYDWTPAEARELMVRVSAAMRPELDVLAELGDLGERRRVADPEPAAVGAGQATPR